jgi:hypothetical protein
VANLLGAQVEEGVDDVGDVLLLVGEGDPQLLHVERMIVGVLQRDQQQILCFVICCGG